ncbi:MAG: RsmB/NOP family class I SAM-dependent RNA methyltransferase [Henriciella sp.]|nr:RsmB/NOP family class I SAM-dependent RNA methyltransferase [Henriciella sp.]
MLRIGAAQSWIMETPDHAVVGETVSAAKIWPRAQRGAGFLNAVLRKVVSNREAFDAAPIEAVWPDWLRADITAGLGAQGAQALALAQTNLPALHLTPKDGDAAALAQLLGGQVIGGHSVSLDAGNGEDMPGFDEGSWWVQDVAAALPARLLGAQAGESVLDLCAAPGGKTMQLAATGAHVTAIDRSKPRLKRLVENLQRTGFGEVTLVEADATTWLPPEPADRILLDAPCSALGTLRRHPEGAWIKSAEDLARFPSFQERLLRAAIKMLKPGGTLVYCVCSPMPREGRKIVEAVLAGGGVVRAAIDAGEVPGFEAAITEAGDLLTLPGGDFGHDAFFISRLMRQS